MTDTIILLVSSLPLLGLFIMGIYSAVLVIAVDEELEQRKKSDKEQEEARGGRGRANVG